MIRIVVWFQNPIEMLIISCFLLLSEYKEIRQLKFILLDIKLEL